MQKMGFAIRRTLRELYWAGGSPEDARAVVEDLAAPEATAGMFIRKAEAH